MLEKEFTLTNSYVSIHKDNIAVLAVHLLRCREFLPVSCGFFHADMEETPSKKVRLHKTSRTKREFPPFSPYVVLSKNVKAVIS